MLPWRVQDLLYSVLQLVMGGDSSLTLETLASSLICLGGNYGVQGPCYCRGHTDLGDMCCIWDMETLGLSCCQDPCLGPFLAQGLREPCHVEQAPC